MVRAIFIMLLMSLSFAQAQTVMDGSDKRLSTVEFDSIKQLFSTRLSDPYGSQIDKLVIVEPGKICGRVNAKNRFGGLSGFKLFGVDINKRILLIDETENLDGKNYQELQDMLEKVQAVLRLCKPNG